MELDSDHVNGRCAAVTRVVEEIATHDDLCAVGVLLLRAIVYADLRIREVTFAIVWNVFAVDKKDSVGTFADSGHASSKTPKFLHVRFAPQFLALGVHKEVPHFREMARGFVKDSVEHVGGVLLLSCAASRDRWACRFAITLWMQDNNRVVSQFGMFGWYRLVFSWYFTNRYQRKTWLVHFGIVNLAGTSFSLKRGASAPCLMHPSPLFEEHRSSRQIVHKRSSCQISARQKNKVSMLVCP
jgi:hypothetical protein